MHFYRKLPITLSSSPLSASIIGSGSSQFFTITANNADPGEGFVTSVSSSNPNFIPSTTTLIFFGDPVEAGLTVTFSGTSVISGTITIPGEFTNLVIPVTGSP